MLSCTSSNKLTRVKNQRVPQNLYNPKMDVLWNGVEHWATYPTPTTSLLIMIGENIITKFLKLYLSDIKKMKTKSILTNLLLLTMQSIFSDQIPSLSIEVGCHPVQPNPYFTPRGVLSPRPTKQLLYPQRLVAFPFNQAPTLSSEVGCLPVQPNSHFIHRFGLSPSPNPHFIPTGGLPPRPTKPLFYPESWVDSLFNQTPTLSPEVGCLPVQPNPYFISRGGFPPCSTYFMYRGGFPPCPTKPLLYLERWVSSLI